jgi:hypothetical protein
MIKLGSKVRDKVTGFTGITTGRAEYLYGCNQYNIVPPVDAGKLGETQWFDEGRIEVIEEETIPAASVTVDKNGGPNRDAPRY